MASPVVEGPQRKFSFPSVYDSSIGVSFVGSHLSMGRSRKPLSGNDASVVDVLLRNKICDSAVLMKTTLTPDACVTPETSTPTVVSMSKTNLEALFLIISEELGPMWKEVGQCLFKRCFLLQNIDKDFTGAKEKAFQMLMKWHHEEGSNATVEKLCETLVQMDCYDATEKLAELEPTLSAMLQSDCSALRKDSILHNVKQTYRDFRCEKCITCENMGMIHLWQSKSTGRKYIVKPLEDSHHAFALRKVIDAKALRQRKKNLRKMSDRKENQKMVNHLLDVVDKLQAHIDDHWNFCQEELNCNDCDKSKMQQQLIKGELTLLRHQLKQMVSGRCRILLSGIRQERIYQLAGRTYTVCEEHKKMHQLVRRKSCASLSNDTISDDSSDDDLNGPLQCTLKILLTIGRRRPVTHSYRAKKTVKHEKLKKTKSNDSTSTFYLPSPLLKKHHFFQGDQVPPSFLMATDILKSSKVAANGTNTSRVLDDVNKEHKSLPPQEPAAQLSVHSNMPTDMESRVTNKIMDRQMTPKSKKPNREIASSSSENDIVSQSVQANSTGRQKQAITLPRTPATANETLFRRLSQHYHLQWTNDLEGSVQV